MSDARKPASKQSATALTDEQFEQIMDGYRERYATAVRPSTITEFVEANPDYSRHKKELAAYFKARGQTPTQGLLAEGVLVPFKIDAPIRRPGSRRLEAYEREVARPGVEELAEATGGSVVSVDTTVAPVDRYRDTRCYEMIRPGDSLVLDADNRDFNGPYISVRFDGRSVGRVDRRETIDFGLLDLVRDPEGSGTYGGRVHCVVTGAAGTSRHPLLKVRIYYAVDPTFGRVSGGALLSPDGRTALRWVGDVADIVIPEGVEAIAPGMCRGRMVRTLALPEGLREIGEEAFRGAPLTEVSLPASVETIGAKAFWNTALESVAIPAGVGSIGYGAFSFCERECFDESAEDAFKSDMPHCEPGPDAFARVEVEPDNRRYRSVDGALLEVSGDDVRLLALPCKVKRNGKFVVSVPEGVTCLAERSILLCHEARVDLRLPATLRDFEGNPVSGGSKVGSIRIPEAATEHTSKLEKKLTALIVDRGWSWWGPTVLRVETDAVRSGGAASARSGAATSEPLTDERFAEIIEMYRERYSNAVRERTFTDFVGANPDYAEHKKQISAYLKARGTTPAKFFKEAELVSDVVQADSLPRPGREVLEEHERASGGPSEEELAEASQENGWRFFSGRASLDREVLSPEESTYKYFEMMRRGDHLALSIADGSGKPVASFCGHELGEISYVAGFGSLDELVYLITHPDESCLVGGRAYCALEAVGGDTWSPYVGVRVYFAQDVDVADGMLVSKDGTRIVGSGETALSLTIPDGVEAINPWSFYDHPILEVRLNQGLKEIGERAFDHTWIRRVVIPASVERIGCCSFTYSFNRDFTRGLNHLKESVPDDVSSRLPDERHPVHFEVEDGNPRYRSQEGSLIERGPAGDTLVSLYFDVPADDDAGQVAHLSVPAGVTCVARRAASTWFGGSYLPWGSEAVVEIPESVVRIEDGAFPDNGSFDLAGAAEGVVGSPVEP